MENKKKPKDTCESFGFFYHQQNLVREDTFKKTVRLDIQSAQIQVREKEDQNDWFPIHRRIGGGVSFNGIEDTTLEWVKSLPPIQMSKIALFWDTAKGVPNSWRKKSR